MPTTTAAPPIAAEPAATDRPAGVPCGDRSDRSVGLHFPVLAEVPELGALLDDLRQVDRLLASCVDAIIRLQDAAVARPPPGLVWSSGC